MTIDEVIGAILAAVPGAPFAKTVDTLKAGDPAQDCTGIAVTFLATCEVIEAAAAMGANLIITHEPTFYSHFDEDKGIESHEVVMAKHRLIESTGVVIWRFHDYLHALIPDPTTAGIIESMAWDDYILDEPPYCCCVLPQTTLGELAGSMKTGLGLSSLRVVGRLDMSCKTVCIMPGFPGRDRQIELLRQPGVDVVVTGEMHEWESPEYARDASYLGMNKAFIILGHAASEEPGMRRVMSWLQDRLPGMAIQFIPTGSPFETV